MATNATEIAATEEEEEQDLTEAGFCHGEADAEDQASIARLNAEIACVEVNRRVLTECATVCSARTPHSWCSPPMCCGRNLRRIVARTDWRFP
jgi:hypothetical protein